MTTKLFAAMSLAVLLGAGCADASLRTSGEVSTSTTTTENDWKSYANTNADFDVSFEYPENSTVSVESNDRYTGYNILDADGDIAVKIVITSDTQAAESFRLALPGGDLGAAESTTVNVASNSLYEPSGSVRVVSWGSLESQGLTVYIIDEQPPAGDAIVARIESSIAVVAK